MAFQKRGSDAFQEAKERFECQICFEECQLEKGVSWHHLKNIFPFFFLPVKSGAHFF